MTTNANDFELIESVANTLPPQTREDFRTLMQGWSSQLATLNTSTGNTPAGNAANVSAPPVPALTVTGANGAFSWTVTPPSGVQGQQLWYEISYSTVKGFTSGVTTEQATTATSGSLNLPGQTLFFRVRASLNKTVWSGYALASQSAASSGLVSSSATSNGGAFNQTNYGLVTSRAAGGAAVVEVTGASGALSSMVAVKGGAEQIQPGAAIVNVPFGTNQFVGYQQSTGTYRLGPTLASVLTDDTTPVGKVSVVDSGTPVLPTVSLVLSGGSVIGWNVTSQGNGLTGPVTLVINTSSGAGATPGAQTIVNGKLISIAPGNPGAHYGSGDTVTVSGGVGTGNPGGGTSQGGNGGRLTDV